MSQADLTRPSVSMEQLGSETLDLVKWTYNATSGYPEIVILL